MPTQDYQYSVSSEERKRKIKRWTLEILVSALLIVPAIVLCVYLKDILQNTLVKKLTLQPDSPGYTTWLNPPITTIRSYHLFNILNPTEVVTNPAGTSLNVTDTRAYTYNVVGKKPMVQWSEDNTTVTYSVERTFHRHPDRFNPSAVNDTGVFVDSLRATFRTQFGVKPSDAFYALGGNSPFYERNAVEQLEGFTSDLFYAMQDKMTGPNTKKSGFVYRYNGSELYNITIKTGFTEKGQTLKFNNKMVPFSTTSSDYLFPIYDGMTFAPMIFDKPEFNILHSDFCSPIRIERNKSTGMYSGINVHEYALKLIDASKCEMKNGTIDCPEVDKLDISKCISETIPAGTFYISKAHFYGSNNETTQDMKIEGFLPTKEKHDSYIYFEPYSGTPLKAVFRLQINVNAAIDPMRESEYGLEPRKNGKSVQRLLPVVWIDQEVTVDEKVINDLRILSLLRRHGQWSIVTAAVIVSLIFIVILELKARRDTKTRQYSRRTYIKADTADRR